MRVLVVEDEPYMAEAIRDGLRLEAIAADVADPVGDIFSTATARPARQVTAPSSARIPLRRR